MPICEGAWYERLDFAGAFSIPEAENYEFGAHDYDERMTMHIVHRIGALITFLYLCWLGIRLYAAASSALLRNCQPNGVGYGRANYFRCKQCSV